MKVLLTSALRNSGMAAIRGLASCGMYVVGADSRELPFNCRSRHLRKLYFHAPVEYEHLFLKSVKAIIKGEQPDVFFPIQGTHLIARHASQFDVQARILVPPYNSYQTAENNQSTLKTCREFGIHCPRLLNLDEAEQYLQKDKGNYVVVKPQRDVGAGRGVRYVNSPRTLEMTQKAVEARWGDCVIAEYIPGGTSNMRTVNLLFDRHTRLVAYFTTRKIRQWPNSGGITALSVSTRETELVEKVLPIFNYLGWQGLAEVELKVDDRDGQTKLIEINPRVWGYIGFPICCGVNFPALWCQAAMELPLPVERMGDYRVGLKYINPFAYVKAVFADLPRHDGKSGRVGRLKEELCGPMVGNNLDWRDGRVILAKMLYEARAGSNSDS